MTPEDLVNPNPTVFHGAIHHYSRTPEELSREYDDDMRDPIDALEIYEHIRSVRDPEHPNTLEELRIVEPDLINVDDTKKCVRVNFTPTVPHCSMTTLIGLSISLKLQRCLPLHTKIDVYVTPGSHEQEEQVNKQLNDKERVAAALENKNLLAIVESCINEFE